MITQNLEPVAQINAHRGGGRIDAFTFLYGSDDPAQNRALSRVRQMAPEELISAGYRDRQRNVLSGSMGDNPHYLEGWDLAHVCELANQAS